jgi:outer membrane protein assembly factor BamB
MVIAATENNSIYALNVINGSIIWHKNLGQPVDGSTLPCGDINPSGITGTPVIDPKTNMLYVVAYLSQGGHELFGLNIASGAVVSERNVDPPGVSVSVEQERGALALSQSMIYIPYGGLAGDCGQYHGFVIGAPENNSFSPLSYQTPTGREGGIWAPSGMAVDNSGNIYVATGNSEASTNFDFGDAVIRLSPSLQETGYFAPTNWAALNSGDVDIGSVGPALLNNQTIFQIGKEGVGYLLNGSNLGGIGGQEFSVRVCSGAFGGTAYTSSYLYVPCTNGVVALYVNTTSHSFRTVWNGPNFNSGPPIVSGGMVWDIDTSNGALYALNATNGHTIFTYQIGGVERFVTPSSADGRVFVGAGDVIEAIMI